MTIEEAFLAFLTAETTLNTLVSGRIYPEMAPQNALDNKHVVYQVISSPQYFHLSGKSSLVNCRIQVDCCARGATGKADAVAIAEAVRQCKGGITSGRKLEEFSGIMGGAVTVQCCKLVNRSTISETPAHAEGEPYRRVILDFELWYNES